MNPKFKKKLQFDFSFFKFLIFFMSSKSVSLSNLSSSILIKIFEKRVFTSCHNIFSSLYFNCLKLKNILLNVWRAKICGKLVFSSAKQECYFSSRSRLHHPNRYENFFLCRLVIVRALVIDLTVWCCGAGGLGGLCKK
jgi:hypothetical protein